jgi:outer membrane protein OmpA-like peptidoglycan-associated protein
MATLLDSLTSLATPAVSRIAHRLGESDAAVARGLQTSVASVLGGLLTKSADVSGIHRIFDLITSRDNSSGPVDDVSSLLGAKSTPSGSAIGASLLSTLFGNRVGSIGELVARTAGFKNPVSGASLLSLSAPLVLGYLGKRVRDGTLNLASLTSQLIGERDTILAAAPAGLSSLVDMSPSGARPVHIEPLRSLPDRDSAAYAGAASTPGRSNRWMWPLLALAALLLIWFTTVRGRRAAVASMVDTAVATGSVSLDTAAARAGAAVPAATTPAGDAASTLGAFGRKPLPSGVELNIPERGIESNLIAFITDSARPVNDTTWFNFDRLNFATGSATILPESEDQLNNIAAVLKAYPNVTVKVGGYTDNSGDLAANRRLSQQRADAVRRALVGKGIAAKRMVAEGYGSEHPVSDNTTEEGRAQNRRIALRVTKK